MRARGTFPRATVNAFMNQLNHYHVPHKESKKEKIANYLKKL